MDHSLVYSVLLGLGLGLVTVQMPNARAQKFLVGLGKRPGLHFPSDARGRLASGEHVERLLTALALRHVRAMGIAVSGYALAELAVLHGPRLSQSTANSVVSAALLVGSMVAAYVLLRPFLAPCTPTAGSLRRPVTVEDYIGPLRRTVVWLAGLSVLLIPLGAVVLSSTAAYDGTKLYWEGLIGVPAATVALLVATERSARNLRDSTADPGLGFLWDLLRARAVTVLFSVVLLGAMASWTVAWGGVLGVGLVDRIGPEWVGVVATSARGAALLCSVAAIVFFVARPNRFRRTLWPDLAPEEKIVWGAAPQPAAG